MGSRPTTLRKANNKNTILIEQNLDARLLKMTDERMKLCVVCAARCREHFLLRIAWNATAECIACMLLVCSADNGNDDTRMMNERWPLDQSAYARESYSHNTNEQTNERMNFTNYLQLLAFFYEFVAFVCFVFSFLCSAARLYRMEKSCNWAIEWVALHVACPTNDELSHQHRYVHYIFEIDAQTKSDICFYIHSRCLCDWVFNHVFSTSAMGYCAQRRLVIDLDRVIVMEREECAFECRKICLLLLQYKHKGKRLLSCWHFELWRIKKKQYYNTRSSHPSRTMRNGTFLLVHKVQLRKKERKKNESAIKRHSK